VLVLRLWQATLRGISWQGCAPKPHQAHQVGVGDLIAPRAVQTPQVTYQIGALTQTRPMP